MKTSTLPYLLSEYSPEYQGSSNAVKQPLQDEQKEEGPKEKRGASQTAKTEGAVPTDHGRRAKSREKSSKLGRERTSDILHRQEIEKFERYYDNWQQIKQECKEDANRHYRNKIGLQQRLISANDTLYQLRQQEEEAARHQKSKEEKKARQKHYAELMQICRQSLAEDRRQMRAASKQSKVSQSQKPASAEEWVTKDPTTPPQQDPEYMAELSQSGPRRRLRPGRISMISEQSELGSSTTLAGESDTEDMEKSKMSQDEEIPWHHEQLYRLYGKEADNFLHPKVEPKAAKPLNPKIRNTGGHGGANGLWNALRQDSEIKLLKEDTAIPEDLKASYSAFVRQCLSRKKPPVKRNFYAKEDVPEMNRLLDQSKVLAAQDFRHKVELMFRSSRINADRTNVLLYNNPPPDMNNDEGEESVERYMPSWVDTEDVESEPEYKKWLQPQSTKRTADQSTGRSLQTEGESQGQAEVMSEPAASGDEWQFIHKKKSLIPKERQPKYQFLTEKDATCEGEFTRRRRELLEAKTMPRAYSGERPPIKSQSAMAMYSGGLSSRSSLSTGTLSDRAQSEQGHFYNIGLWEPLSMQALQEYKEERAALGSGDFQQGSTRMWPVASN